MVGQVALIIPVLNPEPILVEYIQNCVRHGFTHIVVVDDGSETAYRDIFTRLSAYDEVTVLSHRQNQGKGRALKTAFSFCMERAKQWRLIGVITVDSDGQHGIEDVCHMAKEMDGNSLLLGCRDLMGENVPPKSRFGNQLTCRVFRLLYGKWISDTQTGLRGVPLKHLELFLKVNGERYEYETEMLITAVKNDIAIKELPIETIYIENNAGTHFRPVLDSVKIYAVMFETFLLYTLFSLSSSALDLFSFFLLNRFLFARIAQTERIFLATVFARILSSVYNFVMNRSIVFDVNGKIGSHVVKYYALVLVQMLASAGIVALFANVILFTETIVKIFVDICLFFISFQIQKRWIFKRDEKTIL